MKSYYLKLAALMLIACCLWRCSDFMEFSNDENRLLYYRTFANISSWDMFWDLYSYHIGSGETKKVTTNSISYTTGITKNGGLAFEHWGEQDFGFWILLSDKNFLVEPLPKSNDLSMVYDYSYPGIQLSYNGKTAAFGTYLHDKNYVKEGTFYIVFMNLENLSYNLFDIKNLIEGKFSSYEINDFFPERSNSILSNDGMKFWFVYNGKKKSDSNYKDIESRVFKFDGKTIQPISKIIKNEFEIIGADYINERIYMRTFSHSDTIIFAADNYNDSIPIQLPPGIFSFPEQFSKETSEMVAWSDFGISIYDLNTMNIKQNVISWREIDDIYPGLSHEKNSMITFSPDAEYITFGLFRKDAEYHSDLFVIRRDGTELKRIKSNELLGIPIISGVIQK